MITSISITVLLVFSLTSGESQYTYAPSCSPSVTCQHSVEGFVGEDVTLPCIYNSSKPSEVSVYWRDRNEGVVLDIRKGSASNKSQEEKYSGRVSSFPELYRNGNYSIIMRNLQKNDADTYKCYLKGKDPIKVSLTVLDKRAGGGAAGGAAGGGAAGGAAGGGAAGGAAGLNLLQVALLCPLCLLLCF